MCSNIIKTGGKIKQTGMESKRVMHSVAQGSESISVSICWSKGQARKIKWSPMGLPSEGACWICSALGPNLCSICWRGGAAKLDE